MTPHVYKHEPDTQNDFLQSVCNNKRAGGHCETVYSTLQTAAVSTAMPLSLSLSLSQHGVNQWVLSPCLPGGSA